MTSLQHICSSVEFCQAFDQAWKVNGCWSVLYGLQERPTRSKPQQKIFWLQSAISDPSWRNNETNIILSCSKWLPLFTICNYYITIDPIQWLHKTQNLWLLNMCLFQPKEWLFSQEQSPTISLTSAPVCLGLMVRKFVRIYQPHQFNQGTAQSTHTPHGSANLVLATTLFKSNHIISMTWCILYVQIARYSIIQSNQNDLVWSVIYLILYHSMIECLIMIVQEVLFMYNRSARKVVPTVAKIIG